MGAITIRLTDGLHAFVREEAAANGYADPADYLVSLVMTQHDRRLAHVRALMEAEDVTSLEALRERTRARYRDGRD